MSVTEPPGSNFRATNPTVTLVLHIRTDRVNSLRTLLQAYEVDVPSDLAALFREIQSKLPKK